MAPRTTVTVKPELLRWARATASMKISVAAAKIGMSEDRLREWEAEGGHPTLHQLERLSEVFRRPTAAFFLNSAPEEPPPLIDWRQALPGPSTNEKLSSETLFTLRRVLRLQAAFAETLSESSPPEIAHRISVRDSPRDVAVAIRHALEIDIEAQMTFHTPQKAWSIWRRATEDLGALVFRLPIPTDDVRAFSLPGSPPVIVVSSGDYASSQIFSLFHEWTHLMLGRPGLCNPDVNTRAAGEAQVERFCNQVAADLLVPADALADEEAARMVRQRRLPVLESLLVLARVFAVSRYVILRRLHTLNFVSDADFRRSDRMLNAQYRAELDKREKEKERARKAGEKTGGPSPSVRVVSQLGPRFVSLVLDARERGAIHYGDVADLLAVRLKHLPRIQQLVSGAP